MKKKIFSIIVTYNPDIVLFSEVLTLHMKTGVEGLIIIDNNSANKKEIQELIHQQSQSLTITFEILSENKGIGFAQNFGMLKAIEENCTHVILFDQDSKIAVDFVFNLLKQETLLIADGHKVGALGPIYRDPISNTYYPQIKSRCIFIEKIYPDKAQETNIQASFIIASGSLIRVATLKEVGLMDADLFIDCVDIEWCFRAASKGYTFFASKAVVICHSIGDKRIKSLGREISIHSPLRRYYMVRNNLILSRIDWIPMGYRFRIIFGLLLNVSIHLFDVAFKKEYVKFTFRGVLDGILNKKGAYTK
jgi:rhamnosyltransferase